MSTARVAVTPRVARLAQVTAGADSGGFHLRVFVKTLPLSISAEAGRATRPGTPVQGRQGGLCPMSPGRVPTAL